MIAWRSEFSRLEIEGQPQHEGHVMALQDEFSRLEIEGQPQRGNSLCTPCKVFDCSGSMVIQGTWGGTLNTPWRDLKSD
jgi:hypothetical protein